MSEQTQTQVEAPAVNEPISLIPKLDLCPYTIFLLVGPTQSGKSTFASDVVNLGRDLGVPGVILSSDEFRKDALVDSPWATLRQTHYSDSMLAASPAAFQMLDAQLKFHTTYPVMTPIIVVDTTGMDSKFRADVLKVGQSAGYRVVLVTFEYKNRRDYDMSVTPGAEAIVENSVIKFRRRVLPDLDAKLYDGRLWIKHRESFGWDKAPTDKQPEKAVWWTENSIHTWEENALTEKARQEIDIFTKTLVCTEKLSQIPLSEPFRQTYAIIGDSHECVSELSQMVHIIQNSYPHAKIVHIGDYLDKGLNTAAMVEYMYDRKLAGDMIIVGNHETYVYRRLKGEIDPNPELEASYFTSVPVLAADPDLAKKFFEIFEASLPFAILGCWDDEGGMPVMVTHAPCDKKYLGKTGPDALREQRNYRTKDRTVDAFTEFDWFFKQADKIAPLHVFGHISHFLAQPNEDGTFPARLNTDLAYRNKVFLDTGAVYGGHLSCVVVQHGKIVESIHVESEKRAEGVVPIRLCGGPKASSKAFNLADYDLSTQDFRLLNSVMKNNVKFISGTMSPSASSETELEPLSTALRWFKDRGVKKLVLQPKYMGSRAQLYLFKDQPEKTFLTSRAGWTVRRIDGLTDEQFVEFKLSLYKKHEALVQAGGEVILDGELMPWAALGKGLIEDEFGGYLAVIREEFQDLLGQEAGTEILEEYLQMSFKEELDQLSNFEGVLARYGQSRDPFYEPFKVLFSKDPLPPQYVGNAGFEALSGFKPMVVDLEAPNFGETEEVKDYFKFLTEDLLMEGVVAKPFEDEDLCDLPYLKIRSPEYLRLVYGYDYLKERKLGRLIRQKNISGKVKTSIREAAFAKQMLTADENDRKILTVKMIGEMKVEQTLDPRL